MAASGVESWGPPTSSPRHPDVRLPAVVCGALGSLIAFVKIGQPSLWWDEAATISAADRPVGELWDLVGHVDLVHGLYYVVMQFWVAVFGTSEVALRAPSAVALGVAIAGIVFLAARLTTPRAAWIAGLTAAILPGLSWSGIEAREWSIVTACVTWATYSLCVALDTRSKGRYVAYTVLMTLAAAFSVMAILMLPVHLWLGAKAHRARLVLLLATGISCLALPLLHASYAQRRQVSFIDLEATGLARQIVFNQIFMKDQNGSYGHEDVVQWVLAGAFLIAVVAALADRSRPAAVLGAVWIAVPTLILATPVLFGVQLYQARYLTYTAAGACLVMADGIDVLWSRYASRSSARVLLVLGAAVVTACASLAIVAQHQVRAKSNDDYRGLAELARGADAVLYGAPGGRGIAIAYPAEFDGVEDTQLKQAPIPSDTLFGTNAGSIREPPRGIVVSYYLRDSADRRTQDHLAANGCRAESRLAANRWIGVRYRCP